MVINRLINQLLICNLIIIKLIIIIWSKVRIRRWWTKPQIKDPVCQEYGAFKRLFNYLKNNDGEEFKMFTGMSVVQFNGLLELVRQRLTKRSRRKPLPPELRLAAVLNYLVNGKSVRQSSWFFLIGRSTMYQLIPEVCNAIYNALKRDYIQFPQDENAWQNIASDFYKLYKFPNCLGAIDGKHFRIKKPTNSGSFFFNFKKFYSIVLMALCDAYGRFTWISVGDFGSQNDTSIFTSSNLGRALEDGEIGLPRDKNLPRSDVYCPFVFIGDGGFPLKKYLITPYRRIRRLSLRESILNIRLSHARICIERAFGVLCKKFKIFEQPLDFNLSVSEIVISACICCHNYILTQELQGGEVDSEDSDSSSGDSDGNSSCFNSYESHERNCTAERNGFNSVFSTSSNSDSDNLSDNLNDNLSDNLNDNSSDNLNDNLSDFEIDDIADNVHDNDNENINGAGIRDILTNFFISPAGNVRFQWLKL